MIVNIVKHSLKLTWFWAVCSLYSNVLVAQTSDGGFAGGVSPSRFEISADAGKIIQRSLSIYNLGDRPQEFGIQTNDWGYSAEGKLSFSKTLSEDSCRQWVRLERHTIKVLPSASRARKYRFEVHVPEDALPQECRFAIVLESLGEPHLTSVGNGAIALPTTGKIAIIVYLGIGGVEPEMSEQGIEVRNIRGLDLPSIKIVNSGAAHGRIDSEITGEDSDGVKLTLSIANSPIMPGQTRFMTLTPDEAYRKQAMTIAYPLKLKGRLFFDNSTIDINTILHAESKPSS